MTGQTPKPTITQEVYRSFLEENPSSLRIHADKNIVTLPAAYGSGYTRKVRLEQGLSARTMNFQLKSEFEFFRVARKPFQEKTFQLYYFLDDTHFNFIYDKDSAKLPYNAFSNILFLSNDFQIHGTFLKHSRVKIVVLTFSLSWLSSNGYLDLETCKSFLHTEKVPDVGMLFMTRLNAENYKSAIEIFEQLEPHNGFLFPIRVRSLELIQGFFQKMSISDTPVPDDSSGYYLQMVRLEKKIQDYVPAQLPKIKNLAREFNMSESNLKRHFSAVYHKNIYEHYLELKMRRAMELLQKENLTITEAAYELSYEKVSSFSNAFKNVFGFLPSEIKKSKKSS